MDKIKFLMSDTGAEITAACREALEQKGVEVTVVEKDGLKVLQKMLAVRPQVVLLDAFMPGLDALAVKHELEPSQEYKVLLEDVELGKMKTNLGGKLNVSIELDEGKKASVKVIKC